VLGASLGSSCVARRARVDDRASRLARQRGAAAKRRRIEATGGDATHERSPSSRRCGMLGGPRRDPMEAAWRASTISGAASAA